MKSIYLNLVFLLIWPLTVLGGPEFELSVYHDETEVLSFDEVQKRTFLPTTIDYLVSDLLDSTYWVHVNVPGMSESEMMASSCYMQLDYLTAMIHQESGWKEFKAGDKVPFSNQQVEHHCFAFDLSSSDQDDFYLKVQGNGFVKLPLLIESHVAFWNRAQSVQAWKVFGFAFLFSMFVYNFFLYLMIREKGYLYYIGYLGAVLLFMMTISGHAGRYIWPNSPNWTNVSSIYLATLAIFFAMQFLRDMTNADVLTPRLARVMKVIAFSGVLVVATYSINTVASFYLLGAYVAISMILVTVAVVLSAFKRWVPSYFLMLGPVIMVPGVYIYYSRFMGWVEDGWISENILQVTTIVESILLSFVLAYRIRRMGIEIDDHQRQANLAQRQLSQSLLRVADQERRTIARELHDNFGQGMLVVKNLIAHFESNPKLLQAKIQLGTLISDMRQMARRMHPQQIESLGFVTALETMLFSTIKSADIELKIDINWHNCSISNDVELHLYRIMQESAVNIVKHAQATEVRVYSAILDGQLTLVISDNGIGMPDSHRGGLGLLNMRERADIINARIRVEGCLPQGTKIVVEVQL